MSRRGRQLPSVAPQAPQKGRVTLISAPHVEQIPCLLADLLPGSRGVRLATTLSVPDVRPCAGAALSVDSRSIVRDSRSIARSGASPSDVVFSDESSDWVAAPTRATRAIIPAKSSQCHQSPVPSKRRTSDVTRTPTARRSARAAPPSQVDISTAVPRPRQITPQPLRNEDKSPK